MPREWRGNPDDLAQFFVRAATGEMVPLSSVVTISTNASPASIEQFNQLNSSTISALPLPGVSTGDGLKVIQDALAETLPDGFFIDYSGQSRLEVTQGNTIASPSRRRSSSSTWCSRRSSRASATRSSS